MSRSIRVLPPLAALALALAACGDDTPVAPPQGGDETPTDDGSNGAEGDDDAPAPPIPDGLETFYNQDVEWSDCNVGECADIEVPLDYDDPDGETITVAISRTAAANPEARVGSLLINPGGPGASGIEFAESASLIFTDEVLDAYDIIGFDPRGVQNSAQIDCVDDEELDHILSVDYPDTDEGFAEYEEDTIAVVEACEDRSGDLVGNVDTRSAAQDMDVIRGVLGENQLDYLGFSYGTLLGSTYAEIFPENVGNMVLDGALNPANTGYEVVLGQAEGFEQATRAYIEYCLEQDDCPLSGTVDDGAEQIREFLDERIDDPLPVGTPGRELTQSLAFTGIIVVMYDEGSWPFLNTALDEAMNDGTGDTLLAFADIYNARDMDGSFSDNSTEANWAINCLDYPAVDYSEDEIDAQREELNDVSPTFGDFFAGEDVRCANWPQPSDHEPTEINASGADPILVVGTTGDPATPYQWSVDLAEQLDSGVLLTYDGEGHTAYDSTNTCVADIVDDFLINGAVPEHETEC